MNQNQKTGVLPQPLKRFVMWLFIGGYKRWVVTCFLLYPVLCLFQFLACIGEGLKEFWSELACARWSFSIGKEEYHTVRRKFRLDR